jgi:DNA-binding NarL/FixJ family response regulator
MKTLVLIDDHNMVRRGIASWLAEDKHWKVLGEAASVEEAAALFKRLYAASTPPDLALLDIDLNGSWGLDLIPLLRKQYGEKAPPVLVYSVYDDYAHLMAAFRAKVRGYVCKSQDASVLRAAMDKIAGGGTWFAPDHLAQTTGVSDMLLALTKRERQIFDLVQRRYSNKEIAGECDLSVRTVENNLSIIYDKTGVTTRKELEEL